MLFAANQFLSVDSSLLLNIYAVMNVHLFK